MEKKFAQDLIVLNNQSKKLSEVINELAKSSSLSITKVLADFNIKVPRKIIDTALRYVLNEKIVAAKKLQLSDELLYRLRFYPDFSIYQLENLFTSIKTDDSESLYRYKLWELIIKNAELIKFNDDVILALLLNSDNKAEDIITYNNNLLNYTYDFNNAFDGIRISILEEALLKSATTSDIRNLGSKYGFNIPKRLKKEEMQEIIIEELKKQKKYDETMQAKVAKMPVISLQRLAKDNDIKVSVDLKKEDLIAYLLSEVEKAKFITYPNLKLDLDLGQNFVFDINYVMNDEEVTKEETPIIETPVEVKEDIKEVPVPVAVEKTVVAEPVVYNNTIDTKEVVKCLTEAVKEIAKEMLPLVNREVVVKVEQKESEQAGEVVTEEKEVIETIGKEYEFDNFTNQLSPKYDSELANYIYEQEKNNLGEKEILETESQELEISLDKNLPREEKEISFATEPTLEENKIETENEVKEEISEAEENKNDSKTKKVKQPKVKTPRVKDNKREIRKEMKRRNREELKREKQFRKAIATGNVSKIDPEFFEQRMRLSEYRMNLENNKREERNRRLGRIGSIISFIFKLIIFLVVIWAILAVVMAFADGFRAEVEKIDWLYNSLFKWVVEPLKDLISKIKG